MSVTLANSIARDHVNTLTAAAAASRRAKDARLARRARRAGRSLASFAPLFDEPRRHAS